MHSMGSVAPLFSLCLQAEITFHMSYLHPSGPKYSYWPQWSQQTCPCTWLSLQNLWKNTLTILSHRDNLNTCRVFQTNLLRWHYKNKTKQKTHNNNECYEVFWCSWGKAMGLHYKLGCEYSPWMNQWIFMGASFTPFVQRQLISSENEGEIGT